MHGGGCATDEARTVARRLVDSNLVGHDSHGVLRVGKYLEWVREGWLKPNTPATVVFESDSMAIVDGNRGFGQVIGEFATRLGIAKAAKSGIAMVGLRNCGHLGTAGRLGGNGRGGGTGVAAFSQYVRRAARGAFRRQRPPAVDQSAGDRRPGGGAVRRRSSTSRRRRSPKAS